LEHPVVSKNTSKACTGIYGHYVPRHAVVTDRNKEFEIFRWWF